VPQPFHPLSPAEFGALVDRYPFSRRVDAVHVRWSRRADCEDDGRGAARQWLSDAERHGWTDIAQHATVAPDGTIWTGRSWNRPPCSMAGRNGNRDRGPFLIDVIVDADETGVLTHSERFALADAIARVQRRMNLDATAVRLTDDYATLPGYILDDVRRRREEIQLAGQTVEDGERPFAESLRAYAVALETLAGEPLPPFDEPSWAEPFDRAMALRVEADTTPPSRRRETSRPARGRPGHRAICVGINTYPTAPLVGCVADAHLWQAAFDELGFETATLLDAEATREAILSHLAAMVADSRPGDVLAFQFSGHGTQVPDASGDEADRQDEAMCPVDFATGRLLVDDDMGPVMAAIPEGVNVTLFIDCCHSGTINRFSVRPPVPERGTDRARFVVATADLIAAHREFRAASRGRRAPRPRVREVLFAACQPWELAWESQGQGDFTRKAVRRLRDVAGRITHEAFVEQVTAAFGPAPRQHPLLTCTPAARDHVLLAPLVVEA
jgi:hypothetical protein